MDLEALEFWADNLMNKVCLTLISCKEKFSDLFTNNSMAFVRFFVEFQHPA